MYSNTGVMVIYYNNELLLITETRSSFGHIDIIHKKHEKEIANEQKKVVELYPAPEPCS
jgi:hypothetical protein